MENEIYCAECGIPKAECLTCEECGKVFCACLIHNAYDECMAQCCDDSNVCDDCYKGCPNDPYMDVD